MSAITLRNGRCIGDYLEPYVVAELNTSHFGDMDTARLMIDQAKSAGCDCVKFQSWKVETLYSASHYKENPITKRIVQKFALDDVQLKELAGYAATQNIDFASTPYSTEEARFLVEECDVPFVKIASMELNNLPFLRELGSLGVPLVLSTGMGTLEEVIQAVYAIENSGNHQIAILHCTSVYPSPPKIIRLQNICGLRAEFPTYPIGYSDHSQGIEIPAASIALGACLVEKHFTLDSSRIGMDNQMATEPEEMRAMVEACHSVHDAMGGAGRILEAEERGQVNKMRRSMVARRPLRTGDVVGEDDIEFRRPGTGIPPSHYAQFIGASLTCDLEAGAVIMPEYLSVEKNSTTD